MPPPFPAKSTSNSAHDKAIAPDHTCCHFQLAPTLTLHTFRFGGTERSTKCRHDLVGSSSHQDGNAHTHIQSVSLWSNMGLLCSSISVPKPANQTTQHGTPPSYSRPLLSADSLPSPADAPALPSGRFGSNSILALHVCTCHGPQHQRTSGGGPTRSITRCPSGSGAAPAGEMVGAMDPLIQHHFCPLLI